MRALTLVLATAAGIGVGLVVAWFEPFDNLAILAPLIAGTAAALAMQIGARGGRIAFLVGMAVGWVAGLGLDASLGRAAGAERAFQITIDALTRGTEATVGMVFAVGVGVGVGLYLRSTGSFTPERRQQTLVGAAMLGGVIAVMVVVLFAAQAFGLGRDA